MKKLIALLLVLTMAVSLAACAGETAPETTAAPETEATTEAATQATEPETEPETEPAITAMTHEEYIAAPMDAEVTIETYVQAHQSWWDNKITVYCQSPDGAYFLYEMACSEEDAAKLVPGTKILVKGYKGEWAGEVEVMDATFEILEGDTYIAEALDVTALLGTDELINHQNEFVSFKGMTVEAVTFKNDEPGDDIYVTLGYNGASYEFCVERYLTDPDTEVYAAVSALNVGDVIDVEGFMYWYEGPNAHVTAVAPTASMSYADYAAAEMDAEVTIETYVQAHQSWWDNKITVYCQNPDGAYFLYEMACSEEDAAKLEPGTKIRVTGYKGEWAGEVEVMDATFEFVNAAPYIAEALDVTALLGTDELIAHQNEKVLFKGLTVEAIEFKNGEPGDDIYVTLSINGQSFDFCVERYLTGPETEVYAAVSALKAGDVIDVEAFMYWYEGPNAHITAITLA